MAAESIAWRQSVKTRPPTLAALEARLQALERAREESTAREMSAVASAQSAALLVIVQELAQAAPRSVLARIVAQLEYRTTTLDLVPPTIRGPLAWELRRWIKTLGGKLPAND